MERQRRVARNLLATLALAAGLASADSLPACTAADSADQELQSDCVIANPGGFQVVTSSWLASPTIASVPPTTQTIDQYQTTLTAVLNGSSTVYQETFDAPFSDPSVQNAILSADAVLSLDGATFGSPYLTSNSTTLQSSVLSYSPVMDALTLYNCGVAAGGFLASYPCSGVTVTPTASSAVTFGPAAIMIGLDDSDEFDVLAGQEDIDVIESLAYPADPATINTYLTTQSYEIDGTTSTSAVPEPSASTLLALGLAGIAALRLKNRRRR